MWFLRTLLRVWRTEKISNETILRTANDKRKIMCKTKKRLVDCIGHVMWNRKREHLVTTGKMEGKTEGKMEGKTEGKMEGKRSRGRQRIKILDGLVAWLGERTTELFQDPCGRGTRRITIAYTCNIHCSKWWWLSSRNVWFVHFYHRDDN